MPDLKCPFSTVQASGVCHCQHAREVVRRGGSEFDCTEPENHTACTALVSHMNAVALPALGHVDDLTQTPKSVYERVLLGGLQGLRMARDPQDLGLETGDIWTVVESALARHSAVGNIPESEFVPAIQACEIRKRRRRQR